MIPLPASKPNAPDGVCFMFSFLIVLAFVAVIIGPAILASIQNALSRERDL
jgi:Na+-transporting methylmalonyl-CoA/oxaloacetate decarboxylase gamma subunit